MALCVLNCVKREVRLVQPKKGTTKGWPAHFTVDTESSICTCTGASQRYRKMLQQFWISLKEKEHGSKDFICIKNRRYFSLNR